MGLIEVRQSADNATVKRRRALLAAYLRTSYRFSADGLVFDILVGSVSVALDRWLSQNGWTCWVFISACNPGSRLLSGRVNAIRHQTLISHLADRGRTWFPAEAVPRGGTWPPEQGLFVPTISIADARWIARRFGQNALLHGRRSAVAKLLWCLRP